MRLVRLEKETKMTRYVNNRPDAEIGRESRTQVRLPQQTSSALFQGWGPKF